MFRIGNSSIRAPATLAKTGTNRSVLPEQKNVLNDFASVGPISRADVFDREPRCLSYQKVGRLRWPATKNVFLSFMPPAAYDVVSFFDLLQEQRNLFRKMLEVSVQADNDVPLRGVQPCLQSGSLAVVAPKLDHAIAVLTRRSFGKSRDSRRGCRRQPRQIRIDSVPREGSLSRPFSRLIHSGMPLHCKTATRRSH